MKWISSNSNPNVVINLEQLSSITRSGEWGIQFHDGHLPQEWDFTSEELRDDTFNKISKLLEIGAKEKK